MSNSLIHPINRTLSFATTPVNLERWRGAPHFPKLQHYRNITNRLFCVISKKLIGGILPFCRDTVNEFYGPSWQGPLYIHYSHLGFFLRICSDICLYLYMYIYIVKIQENLRLYSIKNLFCYYKLFWCISKYLYIYIYIYCHPQTYYFIVSQLFSVARHIGPLKLESKPAQLYIRLKIILLSQQANHISSEIIRHYVVAFVCLHFFLTIYLNAQFIWRALHYVSGSRKFFC